MIFRSLRARLIAGVALIVLIAVAVSFGVVYRFTGSQLRSQIDRSIRGSAMQLARAMAERPDAPPQAVLATARRYAASQPYNNSAVLLFLIIPGVGTASNHPELFGANSNDDNESGAEQAQESADGRRLARPHIGFSDQPGPDTGELRLFQARFRVGGRTMYAGAGESLQSVDHAQDFVSGSFLLAGALALALTVLGAYLIASWITSPIRRSAAVAARIDAGDLSPRIDLPNGTSAELQVLAETFNRMLDRLAAAFSAQREFIADASHELRTPLTVIRGQVDVLAAGDSEDGSLSAAEVRRIEQLLQVEIARLTRLVDDLLLLAQSERDDFLRLADVKLDELVTELWDALSLIANRNFELGALDAVTVKADPDRLAQALRNLARNAITHTHEPDGLVRIDVARRAPGTVRITVSDDGPGVSPEVRVRLFERFYRIDDARTRADGGAGLGLSIVRAITEAHHGSIRVTESADGGAAFELDLPLG